MKCEKCGKEIPDDVKFCRFCGARAVPSVRPKYCQSCGKPLYEGAKFCRFCGALAVPKNRQNFCQKCGSPLRENAKFCNQCGFKAAEAVKQVMETLLKSLETRAASAPGEVVFSLNEGGTPAENAALNQAIKTIRGGKSG